jgi:hypothetical protein
VKNEILSTESGFWWTKQMKKESDKNMKERIEALMAEIAGLTCKNEQEIEEARVRLLVRRALLQLCLKSFVQ